MGAQRGPAPYTRRSAMHRAKLHVGGADAGAGGMSSSSGSVYAGASGVGASSSSSDASAMPASTSRRAGSGSIFFFANKSPVACSSLLAFSSLAEATPPSCPRLLLLAQVRDCKRCPFGRRPAPPCFVHDHVVEGAVEDRAGKSGARLRLDAALEPAEDGHNAGLPVGRAS